MLNYLNNEDCQVFQQFLTEIFHLTIRLKAFGGALSL